VPTNHSFKHLHFSIKIGYSLRMKSANPSFSRYALYGESNANLAAEFVHIEPISARSSRYEWTIAPHSHPGIYQILLFERGGGMLTADVVKIDLQPASLIAIPSGAIHAFAFETDAEGWVLSLASTLLGQLVAGHLSLERGIGASRTVAVALHLPQKPVRRLSWLLHEIADDFTERGAGQLSDSRLATLTLLLSLASETLTPKMQPQPQPQPTGTEARRDQLAQRFRSLVDQHFRKGWAVPHFASELGTSAPSLTRACHAVFGRSPGDVIQDRIMLEAMRALTYTGTGVSRIAEDLGFDDPAYFTRFFKARAGATPSQFRSERLWLKMP
jgi:AraC family transcriptional activator of pobA